jgi:hypothetical protein
MSVQILKNHRERTSRRFLKPLALVLREAFVIAASASALGGMVAAIVVVVLAALTPAHGGVFHKRQLRYDVVATGDLSRLCEGSPNRGDIFRWQIGRGHA